MGLDTDGASATSAKNSEFKAVLKKMYPYVTCSHCIHYQHSLLSQTLASYLQHVLDVIFRAVNLIRTRALNHHHLRSYLDWLSS
jgi:hypothetical protein